jgi:hypothetical protein
VKDENTKFSCQTLSIGPQGKGGFGMKVLDGAVATISDASVFYAGAENCLIEVRDGAAFNVGCFDWYGSRCHTLVSNATLKIAYPRFYLGGDNNGVIGHHNRLTLAGSETEFTNPMWHTDIFGATSHDNVFEVTAGAKVSPGRSIRIATSTNNVMRISGSGTEFSMAGLEASSSKYRLEFGWTNAVGNVLEILDGAKLSVNGLRTYGKETQVVVSNGTLSVGGDSDSGEYYGIWLGKGANASGCSLVLKGTTPRIEAIAPYSEDAKVHPAILVGGTVLRYEIPVEGYAPGYIPVELYGLYPASARLEIECADWAAVKGLPPTELILFRGQSNVGVENFVAALEGLPENVRCFVRGNDIVLRRRESRKLHIIIR